MADTVTPSSLALDSTYTGIGGIQNIPAEQRLYGRSKEIIKLVRGRVPMMRVMTENMSGVEAVTDIEMKWKTDYPLQALIPITVAQDAGGAAAALTTITVATKLAPYLKEGTQVWVDKMYYSGGTNFDATTPDNPRTQQRECILIQEKLNMSGTNNIWTSFKVIRGYMPANSTTWTPAANPAAVLTTAMSLLVGLSSQAVGNNQGGTFGDTSHEETNYCQITLEKFGVPRTAERVSILQGPTILQRNTERQLDLFYKKQELSALFNRKDYNLDSDGAPIYSTGALDEYIRTDQTGISYVASSIDATDKTKNIVDFNSAHGSVNYQSLNEFGQNKFLWGNSLTKWWICDDTQFTKISNCFDNKVRITYNQGMSIKYGFKVSDLEISGGGTFHLAQSDLFSMYGLTNQGVIVDFDYFKPVHLQGEDFMIMTDVEKGLNPLKRVDYVYQNRGYYRNNPFAHYIVYNL
jgi:hypothetical protein